MTDAPLLTLGGDFYDPVKPAEFPQCTPRFLNERAAESVGLGLALALNSLFFAVAGALVWLLPETKGADLLRIGAKEEVPA